VANIGALFGEPAEQVSFALGDKNREIRNVFNNKYFSCNLIWCYWDGVYRVWQKSTKRHCSCLWRNSMCFPIFHIQYLLGYYGWNSFDDFAILFKGLKSPNHPLRLLKNALFFE
jgi:hypothetical protein